MAIEITSRFELPFVHATAGGGFEPWRPVHTFDTYADAYAYGLTCAQALARLACADAHTALRIVTEAIQSEAWDMQCGEEQGFVDGLAQAAIAGWRLLAQNAAH